jgi:hypothetical protein
MAPRSRYQVFEIRNADDVPCFVGMQRDGESFLDIAWKCRHLVDNALMRWLRALPKRPKAHVLLGAGVQLNWPTARALVVFCREQIARAAGSWPAVPDFALWPPTNRGGNTHRRPVCRVRGETVERFPSVEAAARAARTSRDDIDERIESGHPDKAGWTWWDDQPQNV